MAVDSSHPPRNGKSTLLFSALIVAAILLLLFRLPMTRVPALWIDEAFSLYHARLSLAQLWGEGWRLESSPPLYYTALWAWIRVATDSEPSSRLFSLLLTAVAAIFVFRGARIFAGPTAGAVAVLAWLLPALGLEFSMEIRPYALQQCWIAIAISSFAALLSAWSRDRSIGRAAALGYLSPVLLASTAAFYTHTTSAVFICSLAVAALYFGWATRAGVRYFLVFAASSLVLAILCLPQVIAASGVLATNRSGLAWIPSSFDPVALSRLVREVTLGSHYWGIKYAWPMVALIGGALAYSMWRVRRQAQMVAICVVMPLTGALLLVLAALIQPILLSRTALWLWIPFATLFGCVAVALEWKRLWPKVGAAVLAGIFLFTSLDYLGGRAEQRPWSNTMVDISKRALPGDRVLVIDPEVACVLDHYAQGPLHDLPRLRLEVGPNQRYRSRQRLNIVCNNLQEIELPGVGKGRSGGDWILTDGPWQRADLTAILASTRGILRVTDIIKGAGQVQATRLARVTEP